VADGRLDGFPETASSVSTSRLLAVAEFVVASCSSSSAVVVVMDVVVVVGSGVVVVGTSVVEDERVKLCCFKGLVGGDFVTGAEVADDWGLILRLARSGLTGLGLGKSWILSSVSNSTSSLSCSSAESKTAAGRTRTGAGAEVGVGALEMGTRALKVVSLN